MDKRLLWLAIGSFAMSTVGFCFSGLLPDIAADTRISIPQAGYLITAFSFSYAIGAPLLSALAGAADRRRILTAAMLTFVLGNAVAATSSSFTASACATGDGHGGRPLCRDRAGYRRVAGRSRPPRPGDLGGRWRNDLRGRARRARRVADCDAVGLAGHIRRHRPAWPVLRDDPVHMAAARAARRAADARRAAGDRRTAGHPAGASRSRCSTSPAASS